MSDLLDNFEVVYGMDPACSLESLGVFSITLVNDVWRDQFICLFTASVST